MTHPRPPEPAGGAGSPPWSPRWALLAVAVGLVVGAGAWWWQALPPDLAAPSPPVAAVAPGAAVLAAAPLAAGQPEAAAAAPVPTAVGPAPGLPEPPAPRVRRQRDPGGDLTPDLSDYVNEGEKPTMGQVIDRLHRAGVRTGLGAFPPPGTRPPLIGLAVPEDFALPEGYVRHHQATDDGQRIEAILMFAPGRDFFDGAGRRVELPPDRVVPPELAPPGLPLRRIVLPAPLEPARPGS